MKTEVLSHTGRCDRSTALLWMVVYYAAKALCWDIYRGRVSFVKDRPVLFPYFLVSNKMKKKKEEKKIKGEFSFVKKEKQHDFQEQKRTGGNNLRERQKCVHHV